MGKIAFFLVVTPLVARLVNIGMADPAILDVDDDIVLAWFAPFERIRRQRSLSVHRGIAFALAHDCSLFPDNVRRMVFL